MESIVSVVRNPNEEQAVRKSFELLGVVNDIKGCNKVLIKPNLALPREQPETTSPEVIAALVKICKEYGVDKVYVGDQPAWGIRTGDVLRVTGIGKAVEKEGGELRYFEDEPRITIDVPDGYILKKVSIPEILKEVDFIINAPKMKNATMSKVSLGMKNLLGCITFRDRLKLHRGYDMAYVMGDLVKAIQPNLTVIDAIIASEGDGAHHGTAKRMDLIIASTDIVAVDAVATAIMGYNPLLPPSTQIGMWMSLGTADLSKIKIRGERIEDVKNPFIRPLLRLTNPHPNVKVYTGGICPGCHSRIPRVPPDPDPNKTYAVFIGKRPMIPKELDVDEVYCYGQCGIEAGEALKSIQYKSKPIFKNIPGCPPIRYDAEQRTLKRLREQGIATDFSAK